MNSIKYYNVGEDIEQFPDAWMIVAWSKRGAGKTYGALWYALEHDKTVLYIKRTMDDVDLLMSGDEFGADMSPYAPINRDKHTNIHPVKLRPGFGAFYNFVDDKPEGKPVCYVFSLSAVHKFKGFDMSDCDYMIFDEFIPQLSERRNINEPNLLLDLYMTCSRDRVLREKDDLILMLFANATEIASPITNGLNLTDEIADMTNKKEEYRYSLDRGILLHFLLPEKYAYKKGKQSKIEKAMKDTKWGRMAFEGEFAYNDFSNIDRVNMKHLRPIAALSYNKNFYYIYFNQHKQMFYMCSVSSGKFTKHYDLDTDNGYKSFYRDYVFSLQEKTINGIMSYERYTMYDLIMNYKKYFKF